MNDHAITEYKRVLIENDIIRQRRFQMEMLNLQKDKDEVEVIEIWAEQRRKKFAEILELEKN